MEKLNHDVTGKINLNSAYDKHELTSCFPISCFDYRTPRKAKPRFQQLIEARRIPDAGISINFEQTAPDMAAIKNADRIISTGFTYITENSPGQLIDFSLQKWIST
ncbi:hypothetical protein [Phyllobacterium myrsinacearum]|uniref:Uncharacterized protein n=1 Tax=Phyllobacterium myrsinacearum TaxID=28101 RepID=A0A839ES44_9HYPH|nr:hypothetical protein [Phyllobacterium myrsinacearum]MBA8880935.1 hypothetical protein [Phyllobacterium myrsinacearum]